MTIWLVRWHKDRNLFLNYTYGAVCLCRFNVVILCYIFLSRMVWLFFIITASIDSSPVSTDSSPVSTDSSLLAFLLLEPSPLQSKCTLVNKMSIVLYFEITWFHFIWNEYFLFYKKSINSENKYFCWKNKVDSNPRLPPSHFIATGCRLRSTGSDRSQSSVANRMRKGPGEIATN